MDENYEVSELEIEEATSALIDMGLTEDEAEMQVADYYHL